MWPRDLPFPFPRHVTNPPFLCTPMIACAGLQHMVPVGKASTPVMLQSGIDTGAITSARLPGTLSCGRCSTSLTRGGVSRRSRSLLRRAAQNLPAQTSAPMVYSMACAMRGSWGQMLDGGLVRMERVCGQRLG